MSWEGCENYSELIKITIPTLLPPWTMRMCAFLRAYHGSMAMSLKMKICERYNRKTTASHNRVVLLVLESRSAFLLPPMLSTIRNHHQSFLKCVKCVPEGCILSVAMDVRRRKEEARAKSRSDQTRPNT